MVFLSVDTFMTVDFHHTADVVCFIAFFVCACIMFLFSSVYHTFGCYSDKVRGLPGAGSRRRRRRRRH